MTAKRAILLAALLVLAAGAATAQETAAAPTSGLRAELLSELDEVGGKVFELAEAVPAEKYTWRPSEGVRSVSEVFMHIAGGNYFLPSFVGYPPPQSLSREMEKETDKAKVLAALKDSLAHARQAIVKTPDADLDKPVKLFGRDTTVRRALTLLVYHLHEHLGQAIAYARVNGVVPPWTVREMEEAKKRQAQPGS
jgi:uncharacterized damage-inducible protein DinB